MPVHQVAALPVFNRYAHPPLYVNVSTKLIPVTPGVIIPVMVKYIVDHDIVALLVIDIAPVSMTISGLSQTLSKPPPVHPVHMMVHTTWFPGCASEPLIYPVDDVVHHIVDNNVSLLL